MITMKSLPTAKRKSSSVKEIAVTTLGLLLLSACVTGCGESADPEVLAVREKFVLKDKPQQTTSIKRIRKSLQEDGASDEIDAIILVRIAAGDLPPWETGKAAFIVTDATGHEGEKDHDPHTCPYCSRKINDYLAKVRFYDEQGEVTDIDARELFDVKEKQLVIITGKASIDEEDLLAVSADGIYVVEGNSSAAVAWLVGITLIAVLILPAVSKLRKRRGQISTSGHSELSPEETPFDAVPA